MHAVLATHRSEKEKALRAAIDGWKQNSRSHRKKRFEDEERELLLLLLPLPSANNRTAPHCCYSNCNSEEGFVLRTEVPHKFQAIVLRSYGQCPLFTDCHDHKDLLDCVHACTPQGPDNPNYTRFGPLHGFKSVFPPALTRGQKKKKMVRRLRTRAVYSLQWRHRTTVRTSMIHAATDVAHRRNTVRYSGGRKRWRQKGEIKGMCRPSSGRKYEIDDEQ